MARFNFSRLLDIVKLVSKTNSFQMASELAIKRIGERIDEKADDPEAVKAIAGELIRGAPALVGAIVKGTEAQHMVPKEYIHVSDKERAQST